MMIPMADARRISPRSAATLLHTKLMLPRLHPTTLPRAELFSRLDEGLDRKLILVTAPTGYGKTTLVGSWVSAREFDAAWVTLDENDNDPVRFWTYAITALRTLAGSPGKDALSALLTSRPVSFQAVLTSLINDLARSVRTRVLVWEDFHAIASPEIHTSITFLLQHMPPTLHVVLISRSEPALPLAIMRARDELVELDASSLRFSLKETGTFLRAAVPAELSPAAAVKLQEQTQGWAAGLWLAARSLQGQRDSAAAEALVHDFSGTQRYVADYIIQEVFASQPEDLQGFLLKTCFLTRLTGSLCDAVTQAADGAAVLEQLERENLFTVQLTDGGEQAWYRYHPLFAGSIQALARQRLGEAGVRSIFEQASSWYEACGLYDEAVETALAAKLFARALPLIERFIDIHSQTEAHTLRRWLDQIPVGEILQNPRLGFSYAQVILYTSDRFAPATAARLEPLLQSAEKGWLAAEDREQLGALYSFRGQVAWWQGDFQKAFDFAHRSLEELPEREISFRGSSLLLISNEALNAGRILEAQDHALEARALLGAAQNHYGVLAALQLLSEVFYWQGEQEQAGRLNRQILADAAEVGDDSMLDDQGIASLGLANIAYEQNDLETAGRFAAQALDLGQRRGNELLQAQAAIRLASIQAARDDLGGAGERLKLLASEIHNPAWLRLVQDAQVLLSIRGNKTASLDWWLTMTTGGQQNILPVQKEREAFILARLQIAQGRPRAALEALDGWQADAAGQGRVRSQVEALCLQALAYQASQGPEQAAPVLTQALQIGQTRGFRRLLIDEGEQMAALLQAALPSLSSRSLSLYATTLLHSFSPGLVSGSSAAGLGVLVEPLSQQELRVLRLLVNGLSNAEIARELVVSKNTIKTQVQSIYRKLNVNSRDEARHVARELKLV